MEGGCAPVAVVIVSWNSSRHLEACLGSLRGLARRPAEIVVVDNGSTDGSPEQVRRCLPEAVLVVCGANLGFCRANNIGIARTSSPFVLVLNPDTSLSPSFLEELLPAFERPDVGMAAGKLLRFDGRTIDSAGQTLGRSRQPVDRGYGQRDRGQFDRDGEVFGACGAAALYRRSMLRDVAAGGDRVFDETFFAFYEDLDLAWRARRLGWKAAYRYRAVGLHARGGSARVRPRLWRGPTMLQRAPDIRFHVVKNRYLTILRNDRLRDYLRDLPFILTRDVATAALLLVTSPGVFVRLWRERKVFRGALDARRADARRLMVPGEETPPGR